MKLTDLIFPKVCFGCKNQGKYLCSECLSRLYYNKPIYLKSKSGFSPDFLLAIYPYKKPIREAILALKYKYATDVAKELADLVVSYVKSVKISFPQNPLLIPIPIHWYKKNLRGFNQMEEIGKRVAENLGWRFIPDLLIKRKATPSQAELKKEDRAINLSGSIVLNPVRKFIISNFNSIILFDDVYTTGSTIKEACRVLKKGGAKEVWGLTLAG